MKRPAITPIDASEVWMFLRQGCSVGEIAAWYGVSVKVAGAMCGHATMLHARAL